MFLRMLMRAAILRRGRAAAALLALVVAAAVSTALLNLFVDVQAKLHNEFRNYGANIVVAANDGQPLPTDALKRADITLAGRALAVPFAYAIARSSNGQTVVVSGTDFARARELNRWWSVTGWPSREHEALMGRKAATVLSPHGEAFDLVYQGHTIHLQPAGELQTGAAEDSRVYLSLREFEDWTGVRPSVIEIAIAGSPQEINQAVGRLTLALPEADVRPVRQVTEGEARVLGKTRGTLLACSVLIILTAALCVLSTLMGWVFDRRRDFAIMKALGASERLIGGFVAAEAAILGASGAILGFVAGIGIAAWIGRVSFHAPVVPRFAVFPEILSGSVAVALLAAILPISLLRRVEPATILRGE